MHLIIALRLFSQSHAKPGIEQSDSAGRPLGHLIDTQIERLYPALKNIIAFHQDRGQLPPLRPGTVLGTTDDGHYQVVRTSDCRLHWCLIESHRSERFWNARPEVELVIPHDRFQAFTQAIRGRVGAYYLNACDAFAGELQPNSQRPIRYVPPSSSRASQPVADSTAALG
jgi:hypothetical protein|tara:strand:- start:260 stop:769 length:510 start_codon:yes stop_codon:yes gene_type:complete